MWDVACGQVWNVVCVVCDVAVRDVDVAGGM